MDTYSTAKERQLTHASAGAYFQELDPAEKHILLDGFGQALTFSTE